MMAFENEKEILPTQAGYDRWAEFYDGDDNPLILLEELRIAPLLAGFGGLSVADIGCGTGRHALRLARDGAQVTAVDFSEAMLRQARAKPGAERITFLKHDLTGSLPLPDLSFDRVLCCLVLDHVADLDPLFLELHRICKSGSQVIISVMHPAMTLRGVQARFIEPISGERISLASHEHVVSDYVMAGLRARLRLDLVSEHSLDADLAARSPRAVKYLGWPLLLILSLTKP
jgi:malonyl-CoA O-methyltransferase